MITYHAAETVASNTLIRKISTTRTNFIEPTPAEFNKLTQTKGDRHY